MGKEPTSRLFVTTRAGAVRPIEAGVNWVARG